MKQNGLAIRLLLVGAFPRLAIAAGIVALLWMGFFWATSKPGAFF